MSKRACTEQCHLTVSWAQCTTHWGDMFFLKLSTDQFLVLIIDHWLRPIMKRPYNKNLSTSSAIARSIHQGLSLRFPCNDLTLG